MDDFNKPKIMFSEIVQSPRFYFDEDKHFIPDVTAVIIYGKNTSSLKYLTDWLNSSIVGKIFKLFYSGGGLGDTGYRYKKKFLENLPIPPYSETKIENIDVIKDYKFTKKEVEWLLNH